MSFEFGTNNYLPMSVVYLPKKSGADDYILTNKSGTEVYKLTNESGANDYLPISPVPITSYQ